MNDDFDIASLGVNETGFLHLKNAKGEHLFNADGKPRGIVLYSPGTKHFAAIEARMSNRSLERRKENGGEIALASPDERRVETAEDFAAVTHSWVNFDYAPAGSKQGVERYQACYEDPTLGFIVKQIDGYLSRWGNFSGPSATN